MSKPIRLSAVLALAISSTAFLAFAAEYNTAVKRTPITSWTGKNAPALAKLDAATLTKQVDRLLPEDLAASDKGTKVLEFSSRASDEVFLRRVSLDLIGHNPTPDEVTRAWM